MFDEQKCKQSKFFGPGNANALLILPHKILPWSKAEYPHGWVMYEERNPRVLIHSPDRTRPIIGSSDWNSHRGVPRILTPFYNFSRVA